MSDFEERVARVLTDGAHDAPGADGLADRARVRARNRRRRKLALTTAVAVVALAIPTAIVTTRDSEGPSGSDSVTTTVVGDAGPGWRTVLVEQEPQDGEESRVLIDLPDSWVRIDTSPCEFEWARFGPAVDDPCDGTVGAMVMGTRTLLMRFGPGLRRASDYPNPVDSEWLGYVGVGPRDSVFAEGSDLKVVRRVLASVRMVDDVTPDLSGEWRVVSENLAPGQRVGSLRYAVPRGAGVQVRLVDNLGRDGARAAFARQLDDGRWLATMTYGTDQLRVVAPTQALAEVVAGSAIYVLG